MKEGNVSAVSLYVARGKSDKCVTALCKTRILGYCTISNQNR